MDTKKYIPKRGVFETTLACNLKCRHCGSSAGAARDDELSTEECKSLFEQLKGLGLEWLTLSGGEPMTRPDWADLIRLAKEAGLGVGMITNAIALDADAAKRAKDAGINSIGLSIDGLEATHDMIRGKKGHFKVLEGAMAHLRQNKIPFGAITTICNDNLSQLEQMQHYIADSGAYSWQVQLGSDMGNLSHHPEMLISPRQLPRLEKRLADMIVSGPIKIYPADSMGYFGPNEKILRGSTGGHCWNGCGAGKTNIGIECNGNIKGCLSIMAGYNAKGMDFVEGNIRQTPLAEIWNRPGAFAYNREWSRKDLTGFCASCDYADRCKGGCLGKRVSDGNLTENPMCVYRVLMESAEEPKRLAQAAAVFFALALGATSTACEELDDPIGDDTASENGTGDDSDTASDTEKDTATATGDVDLYGIQPDSNTEPDTDTVIPPYDLPPLDSDTMNVDLYGIQPDPDSDTTPVDKYGMPIPDSDTTDVDLYGIQPDPDSDTTPVDKYGMPMPDSDEDTATVDKYGIQPDTDHPIPLYGIIEPDSDTEKMITWYGMICTDDDC
ncbi:MAG: radical SAM protein [Deltaproteobacteria bacterium]|nr:radical SAM protein [Deltaproteobacteria bacterium]